MPEKRIPTLPLLAFALPAFFSALVHGPAGAIVPTMYATEFGLSLVAVGSVILIARIFDAVTDPIIGYLSDHTRSRLGSRKPWIIAGALLTMASAYFLFAPPAHPSVAYFAIWYAAIYFAWTLTEIPHSAWAAEITRDYGERSRVFTFRIFAAGAGILAFLCLPLLPLFPTTAITPQTLQFLAYAVLVLVPLITAVAVIWGPAGIPIERAAKYRLRDLVSIVRGNKPLAMFLAGFVLFGVAEGMFGALSFLYFSGYLGLAKEFVVILAVLYAGALLFMPVVPRIMRRFGKHRAWGVSMMIGLCLFALLLLLPQGRAAFVPLLLMMIPIGCTNALNSIAAPSLLGDVIDYDTLKTGKKRAATYTALYALVMKFNTAVGGAVAFLIIGLVHYQPKLGLANSPQAILGLKIAFVMAPAIIYGCSFIFIWLFPIDRRRQDIVRRRLDARDRRVLAAEGMSTRAQESGITPHTYSFEQTP